MSAPEIRPVRQSSHGTQAVKVAVLLVLCALAYIVGRRTLAKPSVQKAGELLYENSGLAVTAGPGPAYWSIADSGGAAALYGLGPEGQVQSAYLIKGASNKDWEDIASDGDRRLFVGDIGDNFSRRPSVSIYEIPLNTQGVPVPRTRALRYRFRYPRKNLRHYRDRDAESLIYLGGQLYVLTKRRSDTRSAVYRISPERKLAHEIQTAVPVTEFELSEPSSWVSLGQMATAAALDDDGRALAVLTYSSVLVFADRSLEPWARTRKVSASQADARIRRLLAQTPQRSQLDLTKTAQCEGIAWKDGSLWISNEAGRVMPLASVERLMSYPQ